MRTTMIILTLVLCTYSCEEDFSPNINSTSVPVVYAVFNEADSSHFIRLTKSFQTNDNVLTQIIEPDSLSYNDVHVSLEWWFAGNFVQDVEFNLTNNYIREEGFFPKEQIPLFELKRNAENELFFFAYPRGIFRLIIDIPDQPVVFTEFQMIRPIQLGVPRTNGRVYNMYNFKTRFRSLSNYVEIFVQLHYINRYPDSISHETAIWREFHDHEIFDPELGKDFIVPIEGIAFFDRIGRVIPNDDRVSNRKFEFAEIMYNCLDENLYQYNESMRIIPADQVGRPFSNVVNGMGIVGSRYTTSVTILFDYQSLDELCNGEYTKHLKFVKW